MAGGSTNSREQNFWPGFVDALTNVVLVMVFVVVVFAVVMFATIMKQAKSHVDRVVEARVQDQEARSREREAQTRAQAQAERARADRLQQENQQLTQQLRAAQAVSGKAAPSRRTETEHPPVTLSGRAPSIVVSFAAGVTTMEKKLFDAFDEAAGPYEGAQAWKVVMQARVSAGSPSEARRLAYYRLALLRDHLVARGVPASRVEMLILDGPAADGRSPVTVRIDRNP